MDGRLRSRRPSTIPTRSCGRCATPWQRTLPLNDANQRFTFVECRVQSTIVNGPDERPTQLSFVDPGFIDYFGRPWAQNWEEHFEKGWQKPNK